MDKERKRTAAKRKRRPAGNRNVRKKRKKRSGLVRIIGTAVFVLLILGLLAGYFLMQRYSYGKERADISDWFEAGDASSFPMIINGVNVEKKARSFDGAYYLSLEDVHEYVSTRFYYGEADQIFVYSTPDAVITSPVGTGEYTSTVAGSNTMEHVISRAEGDTLYVLIDYLKLYYDISYEAYTEPNRMTVSIDTWQAETAQVNHDTWLRYRGGIKSDILIDLKKDDRVIILEDEDEDWIKVRSEDGFAGYVEKKRLGEHTSHTYGSDTLQEPVYTSITKPYRISIGWHQVYAEAGNDTLAEVTEQVKSMNTISPTWFALSDNEGGISSIGSADYVQRAHAMGMEVWALVSNFANEGIDSKAVLSRAASRARLTENLIAETTRLGCDGINVDFEDLPENAGQDFIQFIRELSIACRREQLVLSIDNYPPYSFRAYYDHREQGVVADYVIIMGYDEHTGGSEEAGSVSSIEYTRFGIEETCKLVPPEKVINAVPFYTRIWTTSGGAVTNCPAVGMDAARENFSMYGITPSWDAETEQNYGETTTSDGSLVQIWMEDSESIEAKIAVMESNGLAGIGFWRLGLESPDVWDVIAAYVNGG